MQFGEPVEQGNWNNMQTMGQLLLQDLLSSKHFQNLSLMFKKNLKYSQYSMIRNEVLQVLKATSTSR